MDGRLPQPGKVSDGKQDAQLRRTHFVVGNFEVAKRIRCEIDLYRQHEIGNEQPKRNRRGHISRKRKTTEQEKGAEGVDNVIDIKAAARARVVPKAGQGSVKGVAQPVESQAKD